MESITEQTDTTLVSRFYYRVGPHLILLEATLKAEVLMAQPIYALPFAPTWCAGLTSLRGEILPVVDMHQIVLGRPTAAHSQLLLIHPPDTLPVVITCDGYPRQIKLDVATLDAPPTDNLPLWIRTTTTYANETLLVAEHSKLLQYIRRSALR